jgi:hypothetical protein
MRNLNFKAFIYLIVSVSGALWFIIAYISGLNLSKAVDFLRVIPNVVSIDLILFGLFLKWGWKFKVFKGWLVPFPNLNGSWVGHILSDWVDSETDVKPPPIPTLLTIRQSFFHVSCVLRTDEMVSHSYAEGFLIDPERQVKTLTYTYTSKPKLSIAERSTPHDGTAVFDIVEKPDMKLTGRYWTERKTTGEIHLKFRSIEILEEIPSDIGVHRVE